MRLNSISPIIIVVFWFLFPFNAIGKHSEHERQEILYKLADDYEPDEYREGVFCSYDIAKKKHHLLEADITMDYVGAWKLIDEQYIILRRSGITSRDKDRAKITKLRFDAIERSIGGQYDSKRNKLFFLLRKDDRKAGTPKTVDLCTFDPTTRQMERIMPNIDIHYQNIEEPFKKIFFVSDDELLIYQYGGEFAIVNVTTRQIVDNVDFGYSHNMTQAKQGLVMDYLRGGGEDLYYSLYVYDHQHKKTHCILGTTMQKEWKCSISYLRTDPTREDFYFQVDSKVYHYKGEGTYEPLDLEVVEILAYQAGILLYRDKHMEVQAYRPFDPAIPLPYQF